MRIFKFTLVFTFLFSVLASSAQRGIDGNRTVNAAATIVNEYTTLTANAAAGATTITVAASGLNANSRFGAGNTLAAGDLIMIIQMQGATILGAPDAFTPAISNPNDATWGGVTNYNNSGRFEYCQVSSVPAGGTTITVDCGLTNSYTATGKVQVIRVPRYNTLLIQSPGVLTCQTWNGSTGGVLAVEVYGNTTITAGGKISTTGTGFRGGAIIALPSRVTTVLYSCVSLDVGSNKGEGIAGFDTDYTPYGGKFCRGAAANAGGGGNVWNCGGGGGANASTAAWTGQGNPNNSVAGWTTAWNLEAPGFSGTTSSGGGRGGYSFSNSNQNATTLGPGTLGSSNAWGGSFRYNFGGLGGRPLDYSTGRIFMGGGGGAGEQDNNQGGAGGAGGGIIYITSYGNITGSGNDSIISNGANGGNTVTTGINTGKDAAGGAGGGGAVLINSVGTVTGVFIKANGGTGGHQMQGFTGLTEAEGPGGGGGGGYIGLTSGPPAGSQQCLGGVNGISQSPHVSEFLPNGATMGGAGLTNQSIARVDTISVANVTICSGNTASLTATLNGTIPATINWYAAATGGSSLGTGTTFTTPSLTTTTTYYVGFCPGTYRIPVVVTVNPSPVTSLAGSDQSLCSTSATLAGNDPAPGTGLWTLISGSGTITSPTSPTSTVTGLGAGSNVFQWTITIPSCGSSTDQVTIVNTGGPTTSAAGTDQSVCGTTATLSGNNPTTGTGAWTLVSGSGTITTPTANNSGVTGLGTGPNVFQWTISSAPCTASSDQVTITGVVAPTTAAAGPDQSVCGTTAALAGNNAAIGTGTWTLISGAGTITTPGSPTSGITGLGVGPNVFQWSISNSPCTASTDLVTITGVAAPTTALAGIDQSVCGTTATLAGNNAAVGAGTWTLISGSGTITTPSSPASGLTGLGVGANVFQWTISNSPCTSSSDQVTISGVAPPTVSSAGPDQIVCGTTATLAGNIATAGSGTWTLISGTGSITTPTSPSSGVTGLGAGANVFQWTISNSPCTPSTSSVTITSSSAADATISSVTPLCAGSSAFNLTAATPGGTWSGPGITSGATGTFDPDSSGTGTFTVTYTIAGACGNVDTALVTVIPNNDATISPITTLCVSASPVNFAAATGGGIWSGTGITDTLTGTFDPSSSGIGTFTIIYTLPGTCGSADTSSVTVNSSSDATIATQLPVCLGTPAFNLSAATPGGTWTGTGITSAGSGTFDPASAGVGTAQVIYTISGTCGAADTLSIVVTPSANATITSVTPVCADATPFNLTAATPGGTWSGAGITNSATGAFDPGSAVSGPNTITYSITGTCGDTATQVIIVNALPTPNFTASATTGCSPLCVTFTEGASNTCTSMVYDFGDGSSSTSSTATHCYSGGSYNVSISCTDVNGCSGSTSIPGMINVSTSPVATFTYSPSGVIPTNTAITFVYVPTAGENVLWDFGDTASTGNTSTLATSDFAYISEGTYCITLIVSDFTCADTTVECLTIADDATFNYPNVFTPNNDGKNDIFYFRTTSVKDLHCTIYDRWGLKIAEWSSINDAINGWDGRTTSGLIAPDGTYYYVMKATTLNEKTIDKNGFIQLVDQK